MNATALWVVLACVALGYALLLPLLVRRWLTPPRYRLLVVLTVVEFALAALYLAQTLEDVPFLYWFFDLDAERNGIAILATTQLAVVGLLALTNALLIETEKIWRRIYWVALGITFLLIAYDEYAMIHEYIENWEYAYIGVGALLALGGGLNLLRARSPLQPLFLLLLAGLAVMAAGGLAAEYVVMDRSCYGLIEPAETCYRLNALEELFELSGVSLVLVSLLDYARRRMAEHRWQGISRVLSQGLIALALILALRYWALPPLEARFRAERAEVTYLNGDLVLQGYRFTPASLKPGTKEATLDLYWHTERFVYAEYGVSVHLLTHPEIRSVAQNDVIAQPPQPNWLPGQVIKQTIPLELPPDLQPGQEYWLTVTLWQWPWWEENRVEVTSADRELVTSDTVILRSVGVRGNK
jgi:hypothetical protein